MVSRAILNGWPLVPPSKKQYAPVFTVQPSISGSFYSGSALTLAYTVDAFPAAIATIQWLRDGGNISGATGSSYTLTDADVGKTISVEVRASNSVGGVSAKAAGALVQGGGVPGLVDAERFMFAFTRLRQPSSTSGLITAASGTNYVMTKLVVASKSHKVKNPRFHFSGFASVESGSPPQETVVPGNTIVIDGVWVSVNGDPITALTFAGAPGTSITSGSIGVWTDEPAIEIPAEAAVTIFTLYHTAVGEKQIPAYRVQEARGERVWGASDAATLQALLSTPNAASTPSFSASYGQSQMQFYGPDMAVARGWDGKPVALVTVDSIGDSRQEFSVEADARGNLGYLRKYLDRADPANGRTPHYMLGCPGARSLYELSTNALMRWQILDQAAAFNSGNALPFTVLLDQLSQNDLQSTYATTQTQYVGFLDRFIARYPGVRIGAIGVFPRTSSTDNFITRAGQTPATGNEWANGVTPWGAGIKWQLEAFKEAGAGGRLSFYIDTRPAWLDPAPATGLSPATWPAPLFQTTLVQQAGTDGTTAYTTVVVADKPPIGAVLSLGASQAFNVSEVSGSGPYTVKDNGATARTAVVVSGSAVASRASPEGVHPYSPMVTAIVAAISQSDKAKLAA